MTVISVVGRARRRRDPSTPKPSTSEPPTPAPGSAAGGDAGGDRQPDDPDRLPIHWLVPAALVSGAMWAIVIAGILAITGNWSRAGYSLAVAAASLALLWLAVRRVRARSR